MLVEWVWDGQEDKDRSVWLKQLDKWGCYLQGPGGFGWGACLGEMLKNLFMT